MKLVAIRHKTERLIECNCSFRTLLYSYTHRLSPPPYTRIERVINLTTKGNKKNKINKVEDEFDG